MLLMRLLLTVIAVASLGITLRIAEGQPADVGIITTVAGNGYGFAGDGGPANRALFAYPVAIAVDHLGNLFIGDKTNARIRRVNPSGVISTIMGTGNPNFSGDGGLASQATLDYPSGLALDLRGNLYVADPNISRIFKIDAVTGIVTTVAGTRRSWGFESFGDDGPAIHAGLDYPTDICTDSLGNLYIADSGHNVVRKVDAATGIITTIAGNRTYGFSGDGGTAIQASLKHPEEIALDSQGNLYIADIGNHRVRKVDAATGIITTIAGNGDDGFSGDGDLAVYASLDFARGIAVDDQGNLYIADNGTPRIRKVDAITGIITTIAGKNGQGFGGDGGPAVDALLSYSTDVCIDASGNLYITDVGNHRIRKISGIAAPAPPAAEVHNPNTGTGAPDSFSVAIPDTVIPAVTSQQTGSDTASLYILYSSIGDGQRDVVPGTLRDIFVRFSRTPALPLDVKLWGGGTQVDWNFWALGDSLQIIRGYHPPLDFGQTYRLVFSHLQDRAGQDYGDTTITFTTTPALVPAPEGTQKVITTIAGDGQPCLAGDGDPATSASLYNPFALAVDASRNLYVVDSWNDRIRKVDPEGLITTLNGSPVEGYPDSIAAEHAFLKRPQGMAIDSRGNLYVSDTATHRIVRIDPSGRGAVRIAGTPGYDAYAGDGGPSRDASLNSPYGICADSRDNLYIADSNNGRVRKIDAQTGFISTVAGNGTAAYSGDGAAARNAGLNFPYAVAVDGSDNLYIADGNTPRIRRVDAATGVISTVAGNGIEGFSGDGGPADQASIGRVWGLAIDSQGDLFLADARNHRIRMVDAATGIISTVAGNGMMGFAGDGGPAGQASLFSPSGVWVDQQGDLYIADTSNGRVRKVAGVAAPTPHPASAYAPPALPDKTSPTITQSFPFSGYEIDPADLNRTGILVWLNEAIDTQIARIELERNGNLVPWVRHWQDPCGSRFSLFPAQGNGAGYRETYQLRISSLLDRAGNPGRDTLITFRTLTDTLPPFLSDPSLTEGTYYLSPEKATREGFTIHYSEPIDAAKAQAEMSSEDGSTFYPVRAEGYNLRVDPEVLTDLQLSIIYRFTLSGVRDQAGNIALPVTFTYSTYPDTTSPMIVSVYPENDPQGIDLQTLYTYGLRFHFDERLAPYNGNLLLLDGAGARTWHGWTHRDSLYVSRWDYLDSLKAGTTYTLTLSSITDIAGNATSDSLISFTTPPPPRPGDFSGDGVVDFADFFLFSDHFGFEQGAHNWDSRYDLDNDHQVGFLDFFLFVDYFDPMEHGKLITLASHYLKLPLSSGLGVNYPNPFNTSTVLPYQLAVSDRVRLDIYALNGQRVRPLVDAVQSPGIYQAPWDGTDASGRAVATGTYLVRWQVGDEVQIRKLLLLR